jgi:hypothetical protein
MIDVNGLDLSLKIFAIFGAVFTIYMAFLVKKLKKSSGRKNE